MLRNFNFISGELILSHKMPNSELLISIITFRAEFFPVRSKTCILLLNHNWQYGKMQRLSLMFLSEHLMEKTNLSAQCNFHENTTAERLSIRWLLLSVCLSGQFAPDLQNVRINVTSLYIQLDTNNLCDSLACFVLVVSVGIRLISFKHRVNHCWFSDLLDWKYVYIYVVFDLWN